MHSSGFRRHLQNCGFSDLDSVVTEVATDDSSYIAEPED